MISLFLKKSTAPALTLSLFSIMLARASDYGNTLEAPELLQNKPNNLLLELSNSPNIFAGGSDYCMNNGCVSTSTAIDTKFKEVGNAFSQYKKNYGDLVCAQQDLQKKEKDAETQSRYPHHDAGDIIKNETQEKRKQDNSEDPLTAARQEVQEKKKQVISDVKILETLLDSNNS
jgi:hypothetical protein